MIKAILLTASCLVCGLVRAAIPSDLDELKSVETEYQERIIQLSNRRMQVEERVRHKALKFHTLTQSRGGLRYIWQDPRVVAEQKNRLKRMLRLSLREDLNEIESFEKHRVETETELELIRTRIRDSEAQMEAATKSTDLHISAQPFHCLKDPAVPATNGATQLLQDFGMRRDDDTGLTWRSLGWWLGAVNPEIRACASGKIVFVGPVAGRGRVVVIDHGGGAVTLYANLNDDATLKIHKGDRVQVGQNLGTSREKFYFEARRGGVAVNPREVLPRDGLSRLVSL